MSAVVRPTGATPTALPRSVSVAVCTHTERRWDWLCRAVASLHQQTRLPDEIVVVVDHNDELRTCAHRAFSDVRVIANRHAQGLAGARNTAVENTRGEVIAFIDDDAVADPSWLQRLLEPYDDPRVVGSGGAALPAWPARQRPAWFPPEFDWVVGCSYAGLPEHCAPVRNPIGASMSFRRAAFETAGGFSDGIGRKAGDRMGCEETEFSIRLQQASPQAVVMYTPDARVQHHVDAARVRWGYFLSRCYAEGRSKALVARAVGSGDALRSERRYMTTVLPAAAGRSVAAGLRGDSAALLRAAAIVAGVGATGVGYVQARLARNARGGR